MTKELKKTGVIMGDLNLLGWLVFNSDVSMSDDLNEPLAKLCAIAQKVYWERLVITDNHRRIIFPSDYNGDHFKKNNDVPFHILEKKHKYDFSVAMNYLKVSYEFSLLDFKMNRSNMITNNGFINHH